MSVVPIPPALRTKLGEEASKGLVEMLTVSHELAGERFERRVMTEMSGLRVEMHKEFGAIRQEVAQSRVEILKWMMVLWLSHLSALVGMFAIMLRFFGR
jgi:hypothetical protein